MLFVLAMVFVLACVLPAAAETHKVGVAIYQFDDNFMTLYRNELQDYLKENGILAVFHYIPLHSAPAGVKFGRFHGEDEYTTKESERLLRLPLYYGITQEDREKVVSSVFSFFK